MEWSRKYLVRGVEEMTASPIVRISNIRTFVCDSNTKKTKKKIKKYENPISC